MICTGGRPKLRANRRVFSVIRRGCAYRKWGYLNDKCNKPLGNIGNCGMFGEKFGLTHEYIRS